MASKVKALKTNKFIPLLSGRQKRFEQEMARLPDMPDQAMVIAKALHPKKQYVKVEEVITRADDCKSFVLVPDTAKGTTALAYFGAGKYLTVFETIEGMPVTRAYSISSSPKDSLEGKYVLTIKLVEDTLEYITQAGITASVLDGVEKLYERLYEALIPAILHATGLATHKIQVFEMKK